MHSGRRLATVFLACLALSSAGCGGTTATKAPSAAPTTAGATQATTGGGEPCAKSLGDQCPALAGDYVSTRFDPDVAFTLAGDPWSNLANEADTLAMGHGTGRGILDWFELDSGVIQMAQNGPVEPVADIATATEALTKLGLTVTKGPAMTIDGHAAEVIDIVNSTDGDLPVFYFSVSPSHYQISPDAHVRLAWFKVGDRPVMLVLESPVATWDAYLTEMAPTIASIRFP